MPHVPIVTCYHNQTKAHNQQNKFRNPLPRFTAFQMYSQDAHGTSLAQLLEPEALSVASRH